MKIFFKINMDTFVSKYWFFQIIIQSKISKQILYTGKSELTNSNLLIFETPFKINTSVHKKLKID